MLTITKEQLKNILEAISIPLLINFIFHPFIEFYKELSTLLMHRHEEKSLFRMLTIAIFGFMGMVFFNYNQTVNNFYSKIIEAFNLPLAIQNLLSGALAILLFSHAGSYLSQIVAKLFCIFWFGDPDFYITKKQLIKLEQKFIAQGLRNITEKEILQIIDFCIHNLRKRSSNLLGDKPQDWHKTLRSIIYDADLEHFLDQQTALRNKSLAIKHSREIINYYSYKYDIQQSNQEKSPTSPITKNSSQSSYTNNRPKIFLSQYKKTSISSSSTTRSSVSTTPEKLAKHELDKFKSYYNCRNNQQPSEELLLSEYKYHLQHRTLNTTIAIYPEQAIEKTTPTHSPAITLTLPSSINLRHNV